MRRRSFHERGLRTPFDESEPTDWGRSREAHPTHTVIQPSVVTRWAEGGLIPVALRVIAHMASRGSSTAARGRFPGSSTRGARLGPNSRFLSSVLVFLLPPLSYYPLHFLIISN